ncbi:MULTISPECIES: head-tail connector protein [Proteus]|uniref:Phage gp6-like head-tail connector protein n=1 Tax=Proteus columbae TaxID=1987580 RepID=A0A6I7DE68_9GAMM|nr:head-tail connector protein [Proteus columbae]QHN11740.1 phage gp6-like head-tail connector protein [Proteus columbae]
MTKPEITLEEVKLHCRIDNDYDDEILIVYAEAALEVCQQHIGKRFEDGLSFTPAIKVGCLMYISLLYENREMIGSDGLKEVPLTIHSLWSTYRDVGVY